MILPPVVYILPAIEISNIKAKEAEVTYQKQANGESVNAFDHFVTGERIPVTVYNMIRGRNSDRQIPTPDERSEMSTPQRLVRGETGRHILFEKLRNRKKKVERQAWQCQEDIHQNLNIRCRIRMGERPLISCGRALTGKLQTHFPTPAERKNMTIWQRLKSGESGRHIARDRQRPFRKVRDCQHADLAVLNDA